MTEKIEGAVGGGNENKRHREMHRLPGGNLGTWAEADL